MLLERERERAALEGAVAEARAGGGRVVIVMGEAGIGKTRLVEAVLAQQEGLRVLWGACDPLVVPRPLGPLLDVARHLGGPLAAALNGGGAREQLLSAMLDELATTAPSALVVEDLHWVDEATLDLLALLGRRLARSRGCLVLTCRDDALEERPPTSAACWRRCRRSWCGASSQARCRPWRSASSPRRGSATRSSCTG